MVITAETLNLALAVVAIILAVGAVVAEIAFFVIQTKQANEVRKDNAEFAKEMHGLLGELRGRTAETRQRLETQYDKMLETFLRRQGQAVEEAVESETSETAQILLEGLGTIGSSLEDVAKRGEVQQEMTRLRNVVASLEERVSSAARRSAASSASDSAMKLGPWASYLQEHFQFDTDEDLEFRRRYVDVRRTEPANE